jgi:hypothetical protein
MAYDDIKFLAFSSFYYVNCQTTFCGSRQRKISGSDFYRQTSVQYSELKIFIWRVPQNLVWPLTPFGKTTKGHKFKVRVGNPDPLVPPYCFVYEA